VSYWLNGKAPLIWRAEICTKRYNGYVETMWIALIFSKNRGVNIWPKYWQYAHLATVCSRFRPMIHQRC